MWWVGLFMISRCKTKGSIMKENDNDHFHTPCHGLSRAHQAEKPTHRVIRLWMNGNPHGPQMHIIMIYNDLPQKFGQHQLTKYPLYVIFLQCRKTFHRIRNVKASRLLRDRTRDPHIGHLPPALMDWTLYHWAKSPSLKSVQSISACGRCLMCGPGFDPVGGVMPSHFHRK